MKKAVDQVRLDVETALEDPRGRLFIDPISAALTDLSGVRLLRCGVDTVRQLYRGMVRPDVLCLFEEPGMVDFAGFRWHSGRVGRDSSRQGGAVKGVGRKGAGSPPTLGAGDSLV